MSFVGNLFKALSPIGLISSLFGGGGGGGQQWIPQPPAPTPAPPAPDRSDAEIQAQKAAQRRRYGITGGATSNLLTSGEGVAPSSTYSAVTALLGGGTPSG